MRRMILALAGLVLAAVLVGSYLSGQQVPASAGQQEAAQAQQQQQWDLPPAGQRPEDGPAPPMPPPVRRTEVSDVRIETVATGLVVPWDIAFLSNERALVTERPGRVRLIENGQLREEPYVTIERVRARGEGGLMGIELAPDYETSRHVYVMYTAAGPGNAIINRVVRYRDTGQTLVEDRVVIDDIPGAGNHNGGGIRFGPDGKLYVGAGDRARWEMAQDMSNPAGKVLRLNPDGSIPDDNPFPGSPIYALGLRNVQGLAFHPETNELWITTHGPSNFEFRGIGARDAIYALPAGSNAGWPRVLGVTERRGIESPVLYYPNQAVPPGLALFYTGDLLPQFKGDFFFASLRSEFLQRAVVSGAREITRLERWFEQSPNRGTYGRLRCVVQAPDGSIWFTTSNRDGRGRVQDGDDKILRIVPAG